MRRFSLIVPRTLPALLSVGLFLSGCSDAPLAPELAEPDAPSPSILPRAIDLGEGFPMCQQGVYGAGALFQACLPRLWNGAFIVWAHGYVNPGPASLPGTPLAIPDDEVDGTPIRNIALSLGTDLTGYYGFMTTSYRRNGLVAYDAVQDLEALVEHVQWVLKGIDPRLEIRRTYLVGASEGGLSSVLASEEGRPADVFDGTLALCGPYGDFPRQIGYFGDVRLMFDAFFPGLLPGSVLHIPETLLADVPTADASWEALKTSITSAVVSDPESADKVLRTAGISVDKSDPEWIEKSLLDGLRYSFFGTNDANDRLGGNPYDNQRRFYTGSGNDFWFNRHVPRYSADPPALQEMRDFFNTTGRLRIPLVVLHTLRDPQIPYWHVPLYRLKTFYAGRGWRLTVIPTTAYGHCEFTMPQLVAGFAVLVLKVTGEQLVTSVQAFEGPVAVKSFLRLSEEHGASPRVEPER